MDTRRRACERTLKTLGRLANSAATKLHDAESQATQRKLHSLAQSFKSKIETVRAAGKVELENKVRELEAAHKRQLEEAQEELSETLAEHQAAQAAVDEANSMLELGKKMADPPLLSKTSVAAPGATKQDQRCQAALWCPFSALL